MHAQSLSRVQLFVTLWTVTCQAPLSMEFSILEEGGKVSVHMILTKAGLHAIKHTVWQKVAASFLKVTASHKEQRSPATI